MGDIEQYPPAHSAVKVNGERLYVKARLGVAVELRSRQVNITAFDITRVDLPEIDFRVVCSKGTYIRSLIHDLGKVLNNGAYLSKLKRTKNGNYSLSDAFEVVDLVNQIRVLKEDGKLK